jgi:antitoxin YobK
VENIIARHPDLADTGAAQSMDAITKAESELGVRFPDDFRTYLRRWGTVSFGPNEYFGLGSTINDVVSNTLRARSRFDLPACLVIVCDHDGDEFICIDTSTESGSDAHVVAWQTSTGLIDRKRAATFESFLGSDMLAFVADD